MLSVSYAGKNAHSAGKTSGVLRGGASGDNRCYVLAPCAPPPHATVFMNVHPNLMGRRELLLHLDTTVTLQWSESSPIYQPTSFYPSKIG